MEIRFNGLTASRRREYYFCFMGVASLKPSRFELRALCSSRLWTYFLQYAMKYESNCNEHVAVVRKTCLRTSLKMRKEMRWDSGR